MTGGFLNYSEQKRREGSDLSNILIKRDELGGKRKGCKREGSKEISGPRAGLKIETFARKRESRQREGRTLRALGIQLAKKRSASSMSDKRRKNLRDGKDAWMPLKKNKSERRKRRESSH